MPGIITVGVPGDLSTPFGIETGIEYEIIASDGFRASFNDDTDQDFIGYVEEITGLDGADVRDSSELIVEGDGGRHFSFYHGRRPITLSGPLNPNVFGIEANRNITRLLRATNAMRTDAKLRWTATGGVPVEIAVRRSASPRISGNRVKTYLVGLIAADPRVYSQTTNTASGALALSGGLATGGPLAVTNAGSTPSSPTLTVSGPITNPVFTNVTTGEVLSLTTTIAASASVTVDFAARTIVNQAGTSIYSTLNYTTSQWWALASGTNSVKVTGTWTVAGGTFTVGWRDAWL
jgi:hypothetical protein